MGLALDEPDDSLSTFNHNGIDVHMHPDLAEQLKQFGGVVIDFIDNGPQQRGFTITTKVRTQADCSSGCGSSGCEGGEE